MKPLRGGFNAGLIRPQRGQPFGHVGFVRLGLHALFLDSLLSSASLRLRRLKLRKPIRRAFLRQFKRLGRFLINAGRFELIEPIGHILGRCQILLSCGVRSLRLQFTQPIGHILGLDRSLNTQIGLSFGHLSLNDLFPGHVRTRDKILQPIGSVLPDLNLTGCRLALGNAQFAQPILRLLQIHVLRQRLIRFCGQSLEPAQNFALGLRRRRLGDALSPFLHTRGRQAFGITPLSFHIFDPSRFRSL